jgi:DNA-directed RNA polymerase subunit RPC12/RpoP
MGTPDITVGGPASCPSCGSDRVVEIVYGLPAPELAERAKRGEVALGGCMVDEENPTNRCLACGHEFGRLGDEWPGIFNR